MVTLIFRHRKTLQRFVKHSYLVPTYVDHNQAVNVTTDKAQNHIFRDKFLLFHKSQKVTYLLHQSYLLVLSRNSIILKIKIREFDFFLLLSKHAEHLVAYELRLRRTTAVRNRLVRPTTQYEVERYSRLHWCIVHLSMLYMNLNQSVSRATN